jgi:hypothetical protein
MHIEIFDTLSDPTRRRLVDALRKGERQVNDLVDEIGIDQSGVSRHLRQRRFYALRPEPFAELDRWLNEYRYLWEKRLDRFADALQARQQQRREQDKGE